MNSIVNASNITGTVANSILQHSLPFIKQGSIFLSSDFSLKSNYLVLEKVFFDDTPELMENYNTLDNIETLEDDWNGYGALSFSSDLINRVRSILKRLFKQPCIFPTARESIQCEYEKDNGDYLEFEFFESGRIKEFYCSHDGTMNTLDITEEMMCESVIKFYSC